MSADFLDLDEFDFDQIIWGESRELGSPGSGRNPGSQSGSGLLANELPFRPNLKLLEPEIVPEFVGLARGMGHGSVEYAILANVLYAHARSPVESVRQ